MVLGQMHSAPFHQCIGQHKAKPNTSTHIRAAQALNQIVQRVLGQLQRARARQQGLVVCAFVCLWAWFVILYVFVYTIRDLTCCVQLLRVCARGVRCESDEFSQGADAGLQKHVEQSKQGSK